MKGQSVVRLTFIFTLLVFILVIVPDTHGQTKQSCKAIHGFVQGMLPTANPFADTDMWGGPSVVNLNGEFLQGGLSGNDGTEYPHGPVSTFKGGNV